MYAHLHSTRTLIQELILCRYILIATVSYHSSFGVKPVLCHCILVAIIAHHNGFGFSSQ